jgi:hypothetical protein
MSQEIVIAPWQTPTVPPETAWWCRVIADAGDWAARRFLEFFAATIRNKNIRMAYYRAATRFFDWCDHHRIGEIVDIELLHVDTYVEVLGEELEKPQGHPVWFSRSRYPLRRYFDTGGKMDGQCPEQRTRALRRTACAIRPRCCRRRT